MPQQEPSTQPTFPPVNSGALSRPAAGHPTFAPPAALPGPPHFHQSAVASPSPFAPPQVAHTNPSPNTNYGPPLTSSPAAGGGPPPGPPPVFFSVADLAAKVPSTAAPPPRLLGMEF